MYIVVITHTKYLELNTDQKDLNNIKLNANGS